MTSIWYQGICFWVSDLLSGLLEDYKTILQDLGFPTNSVKCGTIKTIIQKEFGDDVGFQLQYRTNPSTLFMTAGQKLVI